MKVGISCNRFGAGGGLERYALDISRAMAGRAGTEVSVYARRFDAGVAQSAGIAPHRIVVSWLPGKLRDRYFSWRLQARRPADEVLIGCNRVRGSDIAICGGTHRGYLAARGTTARRSDHWQIELESAQYAGAHRVVAHSALMQREVVELYGIPEDRVDLIYPPVDTQRFTPVDAATRAGLRREFGFRDDEIVFLFPSSGHARKASTCWPTTSRNPACRSHWPWLGARSGAPSRESANWATAAGSTRSTAPRTSPSWHQAMSRSGWSAWNRCCAARRWSLLTISRAWR